VLGGQDQGRQAVIALTVSGGGRTISRVTEERERARGKKIVKYGEGERGA
jgi:hypothetical protein